MKEVQEITDPGALRALAHPLRLRLLASLRSDGPATASQLGRRLGESSGATSFHLRTLARHGFVEEDRGRGTGRERWWRPVARGSAWSLGEEDPARLEASRGLSRHVVREHARAMDAFVEQLAQWPQPWREAAHLSDRWAALSPERLTALGEEVWQVIERYAAEPSIGEEVERVLIVFDAVPQRDAAVTTPGHPPR